MALGRADKLPVESQDDDVLVYEHAQTGETFVMANPHLSFERIPEVQAEVSELLAGGGM